METSPEMWLELLKSIGILAFPFILLIITVMLIAQLIVWLCIPSLVGHFILYIYMWVTGRYRFRKSSCKYQENWKVYRALQIIQLVHVLLIVGVLLLGLDFTFGALGFGELLSFLKLYWGYITP